MQLPLLAPVCAPVSVPILVVALVDPMMYVLPVPVELASLLILLQIYVRAD